MLRHIWVATKMMIIVIVVLGIAYPLIILGISQAAFPSAANGSIVNIGGQPAGSALLAQGFSLPKYFWSRPSAAGAGWEASASAGSNMGPTSKTLFDTVQERVASATVENPGLTTGTVPVDMVTASGSGLDPDISVANALAQTPRVAQARGLAEDAVRTLVEQHVQGRTLGFLGEPRVNVFTLNLALDGLKGSR
jgi:potassium-transporting ATPase KdpC subunit